MTTENPSDSVQTEETDILRTLPANFVTFYSFKGGVGRSMALINVAGIMAGRGFRILVIDMDLEAPGISFLLPAALNKPRTEPIPGFIDLMLKVVSEPAESDLFRLPAKTALDNYIHHYPIPEKLNKSPGGSLHIMPAGIADASYQQRLEDLNLPGLYQAGSGQNLMLVFKKIIQDSFRFDFVFIDSRTGFSDEAGICTRDLADRVMVISGLNNQNIQGTASFLRALRSATNGKKPVSIVLSPMPIGEDELREQRMAIAHKEFCDAYGQSLDLTLQIPYHPRLALTEEPYIFRSNQGYLHDAYYRIEETLREKLGLIADKLAQEAISAINAANYSLARQKLRQAIRVDKHGTSLLQVAITLIQSPQNNVVARPLYGEVISALEPKNSHILSFLASSISSNCSSLQDQATQAWQRLLEFQNGNTDVLGNYALFLHKERKDYDEAEKLYRQALAADPQHANNLGNFANFMTYIRKDHVEAEKIYRQALAADPKNVAVLGNFANFLTLIRKDHVEAEKLYRQAIAANPQHAHNLGNFANFLLDIRKDHDAAEKFYRQAISADPKHAINQGNFANFLTNIRKDYVEADRLYRQAIAAEPKNVALLGNFAIFLTDIRKDHDAAEMLYRQAIAAEPKNIAVLGNFANFLTNIRKDHVEAEQLYRQAIAAAPKNVAVLGHFAIFLTNIRKDHVEAEKFYRQAIAADPQHAHNLGNFAGFLFAQGQVVEGSEFLIRAISAAPSEQALLAELHFYAYAHRWKEDDQALARLKGVLLSGGRSPGWPLDRNVQQAAIQGHPHINLVRALAAVISDGATIESLDDFSVWQSTTALPLAN